MKKSMFVLAIAIACMFLLMTGSSQASFTGTIYERDSTAARTPSVGPTLAATATFTVDKLDFDTRRTGGTTYGGFLSGGASNPNNLQGLSAAMTGKTIITGTDPLFNSGGTASPDASGTFFQFTGVALFPANITITHDDGFWLKLGNTVYDYSKPVSPTPTTLVNAAGTYNFTLNYGAYNSFPEVLQVPASAVPIPPTLLLLAPGLAGLVLARKRLKK